MNGNIECAFTGRVWTKPEIQAVGCARPSLTFGVAISTQWARVTVFGEAAEQVAASLHLGDHVYVEGLLTLEQGDQMRGGLRVASLRCEKLRNIGRNKPPEPDPHAPPIILVVPEDGPPGDTPQLSAPDDIDTPCPY